MDASQETSFRSTALAITALSLFLFLWPIQTALAQSDLLSNHWFPGAVELLDKNEIDNFPDPVEARRWLFKFWVSLGVNCGGEEWTYQNVYFMMTGDNLAEATTVERARVSGEFHAKVMIGYLGALSPFGLEIMLPDIPKKPKDRLDLFLSLSTPTTVDSAAAIDAGLLHRERDCDGLRHISRNAASIMYKYGSRSPNPHGRLRFFSMASPHVLRSVGIDPQSVERFKPGYVNPNRWLVWQEKIEEKVKSNLSESDLGLQPESLDGEWAGTIKLPGEYEYGEENRKIVVKFWHNGQDVTAQIKMGFIYETHVAAKRGDVLPAVIYRGDSRLEVSEGYENNNFRKLLVGELSDDGNKIVGRVAHYKWANPNDEQVPADEGFFEREDFDVDIVLTKVE